MESEPLTFRGAMTLMFVALKLMGFITWSWWWVLCPVWLSLALEFVKLVGEALKDKTS